MKEEEKLQKIGKILQWYDDTLCPKCGGKIKVNGNYCGGCWYGKDEDDAFEYCDCGDFKHYIYTFNDRGNDEFYIEEIKKIIHE